MTFQHRGLVKRVHTNGTFTWYIDKRVRRFGRLCETTGTADEEEAGRWLAEVPLIVMEKEVHARQAYPLDWYEQDLLLGELTTTVARMARFDVSTGLRDQEVCGLEWAWERRVPDLDAGGMRRSIFVLPAWVTKNAEARIVVLNDEAQALLEEVRGEHPVYVFTHQHHRRRRTRYSRLNSTGWRNARARAAARYQEEQGQEAPEGFRRVRVQDLRHTFGRRLRAAGVSLEDRKALLGHKDREITTHYSAPEIGCLIVAANRIQRSRLVHTPTARVVMDNHDLNRSPAPQEVAL